MCKLSYEQGPLGLFDFKYISQTSLEHYISAASCLRYTGLPLEWLGHYWEAPSLYG